MITLNSLKNLDHSINVGLVGFGFMGNAIYRQLVKTKKINVVSVLTSKSTSIDLFTSDEEDFFRHHFDVIIEVTGSIGYGSKIALRAFQQGIHVITMNAELQGTLGYVLKKEAEKYHCIYSDCDGDQPGVIKSLERFVEDIGLQPIILGNIKGFEDKYRNPTTQVEFCKSTSNKSYKKQNPYRLSSYTDGTKINFEQCIVANSSDAIIISNGMTGMHIKSDEHIWNEIQQNLDLPSILKNKKIVDYVIYDKPDSGVFVVAHCDDFIDRELLHLYKMGDGPFYYFYRPYHLCHFEIPNSIIKVVLYGDPPIECNKMNTTVISIAKKDLKQGETIDQMGCYCTYGEIINYNECIERDLLPIGLAENCIIQNKIQKDDFIHFSDIEIRNSLELNLWKKQIDLISESKNE